MRARYTPFSRGTDLAVDDGMFAKEDDFARGRDHERGGHWARLFPVRAYTALSRAIAIGVQAICWLLVGHDGNVDGRWRHGEVYDTGVLLLVVRSSGRNVRSPSLELFNSTRDKDFRVNMRLSKSAMSAVVGLRRGVGTRAGCRRSRVSFRRTLMQAMLMMTTVSPVHATVPFIAFDRYSKQATIADQQEESLAKKGPESREGVDTMGNGGLSNGQAPIGRFWRTLPSSVAFVSESMWRKFVQATPLIELDWVANEASEYEEMVKKWVECLNSPL